VTCFTGALVASWAASLFRVHGLFSFAAMRPSHETPVPASAPAGPARSGTPWPAIRDDCLSCRSMRQWCDLACLDLSGPCAPSPLVVSALKAARLVTDPAIRRSYGNAERPEHPRDAIQPVLCIYCRTDRFVYWPSACRLPSPDCPGCQRRIAKPAATLPASAAGAARSLSRVTAPRPAQAAISQVEGLSYQREVWANGAIHNAAPAHHPPLGTPAAHRPAQPRCAFRESAMQSPQSDPVLGRQRPGRLLPAPNDHVRLSRQVTAAESAAAPEMSHREAAGR
jgi:hypothetical protein